VKVEEIQSGMVEIEVNEEPTMDTLELPTETSDASDDDDGG
jgi:hypothetical protein